MYGRKVSNRKRLEIPQAEIYQFLRASRRRQLLWITGILAFIVGSLIALRVAMVGAENTLYVGPIALAGLIGLFTAVKAGFSTRYASVILLGILTSLLALLGLLSGGLDGPAIVVAPFIPLLGVLVHGQRAGVVCALICAGIVIGFALAHKSGVEFSTHGYDVNQRSMVRAAFLVAFIIASTFVGNHFARISDAMAASIWQHATHDHLTGLANRRSLDHALDRELSVARRNKTPLSLMMIDIDHFKSFNDNNGHIVGDQCLKAVADSLQHTVRRPADIVARFGGEEFVVMLPDTPLDNAMLVGETLRNGIDRLKLPYSPNSKECVTVSVGIATTSSHSDSTAQALLSQADAALYEAKKRGRNRVETAAPCEQIADGIKSAANDGESIRTRQA